MQILFAKDSWKCPRAGNTVIYRIGLIQHLVGMVEILRRVSALNEMPDQVRHLKTYCGQDSLKDYKIILHFSLALMWNFNYPSYSN